VEDHGTDGIEFTITSGNDKERFELEVAGAHNAYNAALASAVARRMGISWEDIHRGLSKLKLTGKRLLVSERDGMKIIDDSYNAAPQSMRSAIDTLMNTEGKRHVVILAGMNELGDDSFEQHLEVGRYAANKGVDLVIAVEDKGRGIVEGAMGNHGTYATWYPDKGSLIAELDSILVAGDAILVKGSNAYAMTEVAQAIGNDKETD
jgi:UDP-N-acetylmuramoyl-tripeptide--D-alanyl-D-alanine ligase